MSEVSFDEDQQFVSSPVPMPSSRGGILALTVRLGLAKDVQGAERTLLIIAALLIIATIGIFILGSGKGAPPANKATVPLPNQIK